MAIHELPLHRKILLEPVYKFREVSPMSVSRTSTLKELWDFLKVRKKWWLGPIIIVLILLSFLIVFTQSSALAPFIYAIF
jgi:hypothetical protein